MRQRNRSWIITGMAPLVLLAACSEQSAESDNAVSSQNQEAAEVMAPDTMAPDRAAPAPASQETATDAELPRQSSLPDLGQISVSLPKLAYIYDFSYRMPGQDIGKLQRHHADLCEQQGPASCRILGMNLSGERDEDINGTLQMAVATQHARAFGALLNDEAENAGASQQSANIASDDVSKTIVDTQAQLRARTELRDRLTEILRTKKGSVQELVEAERSVAEVNQEIDQAQSWLHEVQGRVAFSRVNVHYESGAAPASDFMAPIRSVSGSIGSILGWMVALLILTGTVFGPVALVTWLIMRHRRKSVAETA
ncbi:MAG: DUF4349 domain-containing protein [Sphingomonadaceae bacterium]